MLEDKPYFSRLVLRVAGHRVGRYMSTETMYMDSKCEISVLETTMSGAWNIVDGKILNLAPSRIRLMPLDPRVADAMNARKACGFSWNNAEMNDISKSPCAKGRLAQYVARFTPTPTFNLYDCEGRPDVGPGCEAYSMVRTRTRIATTLIGPPGMQISTFAHAIDDLPIRTSRFLVKSDLRF